MSDATLQDGGLSPAVRSQWIGLFADRNITSVRLAAFLRSEARRRDYLSTRCNLLASPIAVSSEELARLSTDLLGLSRLLFDSCRRLYAGNAGEMARALGMPPAVASLLGELSEEGYDGPNRWDLVRGDDGWRVLEANVDGGLGGLTVARLNPLYDGIARTLALPEERWDDTITELTRFIARKLAPLGPDAPIAIIDDDKTYAEHDFFLRALRTELVVGLNRRIEVGKASELTWHGGKLQLRGTPIAAVYNVFCLYDAVDYPDRYVAWLEAVRRKAVIPLVPLSAILYSQKRCLALLSELAAGPGPLSPQERDLVSRLLPPTRVLSTATLDYALSRKDGLVLKPSDGNGGRAVLCGWWLSRRAWKEALGKAIEGSESFILQERIGAVPAPVAVYTTAEKLLVGTGRPVVGVFTFGSTCAGGMVRASTDDCAIVNVARGAGIGVLRIFDPSRDEAVGLGRSSS